MRSLIAIQRLWQKHLVLIFRDQSLSKNELVRFSARFGNLDEAPNDKFGQILIDGYPELAIISNVKEDGWPIGGLATLKRLGIPICPITKFLLKRAPYIP